MQTSIGGDRLGSGNSQKINLRNYERSTHDLSATWRSSMAAGTLVPFLKQVGLPGDTWDIELNCEVLTLPTIGPLFGSFKVQLDVFSVPFRLYNAQLHMNKLGIGMDMSQVILPQVRITAYKNQGAGDDPLEDNAQINPSSIAAYLGMRGIGRIDGTPVFASRHFNAIPWLGYWDIYKNYYANKQEGIGKVIHSGASTLSGKQAITGAPVYNALNGNYVGNCYDNLLNLSAAENNYVIIQFDADVVQPAASLVFIEIATVSTAISTAFNTVEWVVTPDYVGYKCSNAAATGAQSWKVPPASPGATGAGEYMPGVSSFLLSNIDDMREDILQWSTHSLPFQITSAAADPYGFLNEESGSGNYVRRAVWYNQEGLALKTYQSDLFNNWMSTDWIDGPGGINEISAVDTTGNSFTIDSFNLASKVYKMLNRIAISGGSYDDWLNAVYTHERSKGVESPQYHGSLIKELAFQEVIANSRYEGANESQPLGQLAGRGRLTQKHKGGKIVIRCDEPCYILGIVSLTPRVDYSQGNDWDVNLVTMDDLHKPALDGIGYQDLITDQLAWADTVVDADAADAVIFSSIGKQPAWLNYMTNVNKTFGNFAVSTKDMFMTLNRKYEHNTFGVTDQTTYIDPAKFNNIFAETSLDAQNFWVQIHSDIKARRKMSAKVIPNL